MSSNINKKVIDTADIGVLAANLRNLMRRINIDSSELSKRTGIALTTINGLKRGNGNPTLLTLSQLAEFFNITIGQLTERNLSEIIQNTYTIYEVPLLLLDELSDFLRNKNRYKRTISTELDASKPNKYYAVRINNNVMSPLFEKGTIFIITQDMHPYDGDIVLVQFDSHPPCFRKIFIEGKSYFFKPISELIGNNAIKIKDGNFVVHGIVVKAIQNFHDV